MQQGNEKLANLPGRPAAPFPVNPQNSAPFRSPGPPVGFGAPATSQSTVPFSSSGPLAGPESSVYRSPQPPSVRFNGPSSPPASYPMQSSYAHLQPQAPGFPPAGQPMPPFRGPLGRPPAVSPPMSLHPQPQIPLVPTGLPPQTLNQVPSRGIMPPPPSESPFSAARPLPQAPVYGQPNSIPRSNFYQPPHDSQFSASKPASQPPTQAFQTTSFPPAQPTFHSHQAGFMPPPPPPTGVPSGLTSREHMQYPNAGPPMGGNLQGLVEDFQSLSVGSVPGSIDAGIDPESLPRPLDGDKEPTSVLEMYPLNCHPKFLRLTTHAIPSSQSLLSRWHLPLGAVVHPLAEVPNGVSKLCTYTCLLCMHICINT